MRKQLTATVVVLSLFMGNLPSVSANDLVDFLNALHAISNAAAQRDHHDQHHRLAYRTASSPYLIAPSYSRRDSGIRISVGPQSSHSLFHSSRRPSSRIERHYHVGDIVTHPVRLSHCVRIRNPHRIAPDAIPVVMAVQDPHYRHVNDPERIVFVEVMLPQCELRRLDISSGRSRIRLDYEHFSVNIQSSNDVVTITYGR